MEAVSIDKATFMVAFHGLSIRGKFIFNEPSTLVELIKKYNKYGIYDITEFDIFKNKFKRVSKTRLKSLWGWDTECMELLKQINFF